MTGQTNDRGFCFKAEVHQLQEVEQKKAGR